MRIWYERGIKAKPVGYEIQRLFSPSAFMGYPTRGSDNQDKMDNDMQLLKKFYSKYPEVKYFPQATRMNVGWGGIIDITHPAAVFIKKQRQLINKGYTEQKAFEIVETDIGKFINQQKEELRILRGVAISTFGDSYLDRFTQVAEQESSLKVKRMERDIPKYLRANESWVQELNQHKEGTKQESSKEDISYERESVEDLLVQENTAKYGSKDPVKDY